MFKQNHQLKTRTNIQDTPLVNTVVKTRACSRDQIWPAGHRISRAKILRKTLSHKISRRKLKCSQESVKGSKGREKEKNKIKNSRLRTPSLLKYGHPQCRFNTLFWVLPKPCTRLKHHNLMACVLANNFCETAWLWRPEKTPPSHNNARTHLT